MLLINTDLNTRTHNGTTVNPKGTHARRGSFGMSCRSALLGQSGEMSSVIDVMPPTDLKLQVRTWSIEGMKEATDVKPQHWPHSEESETSRLPPDLCSMHCTSNNATGDC